MTTTLGRIIEEHQQDIIRRWEAEANCADGASGLSRKEFQNLLPVYLSSLALRLALPAAPGKGDPERLIESHLATRLRQGFSLDEIINEFAILGRSISATWVSNGDRPDATEIDRLHHELNWATTAAAALFGEKLVEEQQFEKRHLRQLQKVVSEPADEKDLVPLDDRVRAALLLIAESVRADLASFYLHEPGRNELVLLASIGDSEDPPKAGACAGPGSLAESAATTRETSFRTYVGPDDSGAHGRRGVRAELAVAITPREKILGVLQVGLREARPFAPREIRMFETLGERLGLLLENARLNGNLAVANQDLRLERDLREQFVAVLAHDLLGPLAAAKMGAQMLSMVAERPDDRQAISRKIVHNIARTDRMVRDLLDVHQIRAGHRLVLRLAETDLVAVVRELVKDLTSLNGERFVLHTGERLVGIWDASDLQRALWNLVTNALKYGAADAPVVLTLSGDSRGVQVMVHNDGPAIPLEEQATLFEPFVRTQRAQATTIHGWGLGLALVRGCAEAHGGKIEIDSRPGSGTTFTLTLPYDARPFQADAAQTR